MNKKNTLRQARRLILDLAQPAPTETIALENALGRVLAEPAKSLLPVPSFNSSTMDGFAVNSLDIAGAKKSRPVELEVCGEIPAGLTAIPRLRRGQTLRIMTGGAVPPGADLILPQEDVGGDRRIIRVTRPGRAGEHIRKRGCDLGKGRLVARKGQAVSPEHLGLLATAGVKDLLVHQRPKVAVLCTGSELIEPGVKPEAGRVISSNCLQLAGLVEQCGATIIQTSIIPDRSRDIKAGLEALLPKELPLIITTGGMGPGDFDLMADVFKKMAINTIYSSLEVRPGRATMLGVSGKSMIMALPGPPPAVRLLFNELARPALGRISGETKPMGNSFKATLSGSFNVRRGSILHLRGGIFNIKGGETIVRQAKKTEPINCVMILPAGRSRFRTGEIIAVHPTHPID